MKIANKKPLSSSKTDDFMRSPSHIINMAFGHNPGFEENATYNLYHEIKDLENTSTVIVNTILSVGIELAHRYFDTKESIEIAQLLYDAYHKYENKPESLTKEWLPEFLRITNSFISQKNNYINNRCYSCASRVVMKMGANEKEAVMVAGLSGGIALNGTVCGAYIAALWFKILMFFKKNPETKNYPYESVKRFKERFLILTDNEMLCPNLSGRTFKSAEEHSNFVLEGGCNKLIDLISEL